MDEVTTFAFEGGDTEPSTAAEIKKRNEALQELTEKQNEVMAAKAEAEQAAYDNQIDAERKVAESTNALVTGEPVITRPEGTEK
jgi:hypothetical protein